MASGVMASSRRTRSQSSRPFGSRRYGQVGVIGVAHVEEVTEHRNRIALLPVAEQFRDGNAEELAVQVQQCRFDRGDRVHRGAQVEGLGAAAAGIPVRELGCHGTQQRAEPCHRRRR